MLLPELLVDVVPCEESVLLSDTDALLNALDALEALVALVVFVASVPIELVAFADAFVDSSAAASDPPLLLLLLPAADPPAASPPDIAALPLPMPLPDPEPHTVTHTMPLSGPDPPASLAAEPVDPEPEALLLFALPFPALLAGCGGLVELFEILLLVLPAELTLLVFSEAFDAFEALVGCACNS